MGWKLMPIIYKEGDLLESGVGVICQQLNCLAVRPHGLSETISNRFPYANVYSRRRSNGGRNLAIKEDQGIPGEIVVSKSEVISSGYNPIVVGIYGQYDYGKPHRPYTLCPSETAEMRIQWFKSGLDKLKQFLLSNSIHEVAFPYLIGCNLAGGDWNIYSKLLLDFATDTKIHVIIYKL